MFVTVLLCVLFVMLISESSIESETVSQSFVDSVLSNLLGLPHFFVSVFFVALSVLSLSPCFRWVTGHCSS